jgi:hypothetical protein
MADFMPRSDDTLNTWLDNFKAKLATHAAALNINAADVSAYQNQCDALIATVLDVNNARQQFKNKVDAKDALKEETIGNIRTLANRIKTEAAYTTAIGSDLNIIGAATTVDTAAAKPMLTASINGGQVVIAFKKQQSNGIKLYSKRAAETEFSFLAMDTHSPYNDTRNNAVAGQPETRQYYAFFIDTGDNAYGIQSDVVSIKV